MKLVTKQSAYSSKDKLKAASADQMIAIGARNSSTAFYAKHNDPSVTNTGMYTDKDSVFVSVNGQRRERIPVRGTRIEELVRKAASASAVIIADDRANRSRIYNIGERELAALLQSLGYTEVGESGVWVPF